MQSAFKKFGNSTGAIIPKPMLSEMGAEAGDKIDIAFTDGQIVIKLINEHPRAGWAEAAAAIAAAGDDELVLGDFPNDDDETEWVW
ncbi:AbrB/MazE/SpoVT family DNA-binding domain-containing protein [Devosia ginsengisoli]|uniref:AbrB/MazE/SpoVT family DNA-binding domain-containing protein n=1 Tax=Devosia ginsengisoli TaxID=400770 RepID=UPI0026EBBDEC|nr:AbrB/MazE/SpoVT family DNA-binding domain-containing protein [Devosia ginsengisoli]MCR6670285.1 AbrB/MazE/SpoVT family DNA-binding domain-containing protein [Devosia ginsengisoli]